MMLNNELKHPLFNLTSSRHTLHYNCFVTNHDIIDNDNTVKLLKEQSCLGFLGDIIIDYHYGESEQDIDDDFEHYKGSPVNLRQFKNFGIIVHKSELGVEVITEVAKNWHLDISITEVFNDKEQPMIVITCPIESFTRTKWQFQGLMQLYRYCFKVNEIPNKTSDIHQSSSWEKGDIWNIWQLSKIQKEFGKAYEYIEEVFFHDSRYFEEDICDISHQCGIMELSETILKQIADEVSTNQKSSSNARLS